MYQATIGLEVHAELKTKSKMFCGCPNDPHASQPNTNICPVCMAHPGTLPVPNRTAIEHVLTFGVAVGGRLATYSEFDRKNYFYPDIPKAYQLSQYAFPFVVGGELSGVALTRVHLEEDTARSQHDKGEGSLVDYNRAGVPLMELVTEPVIHDAATAGTFARELQLLLRTIGISDANMEKGEMRVEANISVSNSGQLGTKVEVKNLNSFRSVESAIEFEIARQTALYEAGGTVTQETRGWDEVKQETYLQRSKETAKDYRYFPDPDIPKIDIANIPAFSETTLRAKLPELPREKVEKYSFLGLTSAQIETVLADRDLTCYLDELLSGSAVTTDAKLYVNYILTDLAPQVVSWSSETTLSPAHLAGLLQLVATKKITSRVAKDIIIEFANADTDVVQVVTERNLLASADALDPIVIAIIAQHGSVVADYKAGKEAALQFLLGQVMKQTRGAADPATAKECLLSHIGSI